MNTAVPTTTDRASDEAIRHQARQVIATTRSSWDKLPTGLAPRTCIAHTAPTRPLPRSLSPWLLRWAI